MTFPSSTARGGPRRRNRVPSMKQQKQPKSAPPNRGSTQAGTCGQRSVVGRTSRPGGLRVPAPCGDDYEASNVRSNSDNDVEGSPAGQRQRGVGGPGGEQAGDARARQAKAAMAGESPRRRSCRGQRCLVESGGKTKRKKTRGNTVLAFSRTR